MHKAWYILNYHDVSWENNPLMNAVGETFPPDVFADQVAALANKFELVSIADGWERLQQGSIDAPLLSFWFDDGYAGVRRYAAPILADHGVTGGVAVNSDFTLRRSLFWRLKLSWIRNRDGLRFLRSRLKPYGFTLDDSVRTFTLRNANPEIVAAIDELYERFSNETDRQDAWRLFDTADGIRELAAAGWDISNHTARHLPLRDDHDMMTLQTQFGECERALQDELGIEPRYWVLPFGEPFYDKADHQQLFEQLTGPDKVMVYNSNTANRQADLHRRQLQRIWVPPERGRGLVRTLKNAPVYAG